MPIFVSNREQFNFLRTCGQIGALGSMGNLFLMHGMRSWHCTVYVYVGIHKHGSESQSHYSSTEYCIAIFAYYLQQEEGVSAELSTSFMELFW